MAKFSEMGLAPELQRSLDKLGFETPTPVQKQVLDKFKPEQDIMACAETGSGKTAAYGIPSLSVLFEDKKAATLILAPTRELVRQIADFMIELVRHAEGMSVVSLVGGADIRKQTKALKRKPRVIVATPGRLNDHLRRKSLSLKNVKVLTLDEGDRMLDMGFAPQLDEILKHLPEERQTMLFTATLPKKVKELASSYLQNPIHIQIGEGSLPVEKIKQSILEVTTKRKKDFLVEELNERKGSVVVFLRTKVRADEVAKNLREYGFKVTSIHGGKTQGQRNKALQNFKSGKLRILCATDVAARGLDVPQVEHVINYDLPRMDEDYVHRIGRTGRNGAEGEALSFVAPSDVRAWQLLVKKYKIKGCELSAKWLEQQATKKKGRKKPSGPRRAGQENSSSKKFGKKKTSKFGAKKKKAFSKKSSSSGFKKESGQKNSGKKFSGKKPARKSRPAH